MATKENDHKFHITMPKPTETARASHRITSESLSLDNERGQKFSSSISRELYTIKSVESIGSMSTSGSGLRNASDGELPVKRSALPCRNKLLSSLLDGHDYGSTEESTEYGSGSWSGSQSTDYSSDEAFLMVTSSKRENVSLGSSAISEVTHETGLTTSGSKATEVTSLVEEESNADLNTLVKEAEDGVYESGSYDSDDADELETFITGESETYHSDGEASGEESFTLSTGETESYISETYDSDESETYLSPQKSGSHDGSLLSVLNTNSRSGDLSSCASNADRSEGTRRGWPMHNAGDKMTLARTFGSQNIRMTESEADSTGSKPNLPTRRPATPSQRELQSSASESPGSKSSNSEEASQHERGTMILPHTTGSKVIRKSESKADSTGSKPHLPTRRPATPSQRELQRFPSERVDSESFTSEETSYDSTVHEDEDVILPPLTCDSRMTGSNRVAKSLNNLPCLGPLPPVPREHSLPFLNISTMALEHVQYVTSFDVASSSSDLSTVDQQITKEIAADVFIMRVIPVNIPFVDQEDVSTMYDGTQIEDDGENATKATYTTNDLEMGFQMPTLKFRSKEETISTPSSIYQRSKLEIGFMVLIVVSTITLVILMAILVSNR